MIAVQKVQPELKCDMCGFAIHTHELAFEFSGRFVDFIDRVQGMGSFCLCNGCRDKMIQYQNEDIKIAKTRRAEAFGGEC
jgi:hypothetical protein